LLGESDVSSFVISLQDGDTENGFGDLQRIVQAIDTKDSLLVTLPYVGYFGATDWQDVVPNLSKRQLVLRTQYDSPVVDDSDLFWLGEFSYFDFASGNLEDWFAGVSCKTIKSSYDVDGKKGLAAVLQASSREPYSEILCLYKYPESFQYTPKIRFSVAISGEQVSEDGLYELIVTMGSDQNLLTSEYIIAGNTPTEIWLDASQYGAQNLANYLKISMRSLNGDAEEYTLWIYDVMGVSETLSTEELAIRIAEERRAIRNDSISENSDEINRDLMWIVVIILGVITVAIIIGCFIMQNYVKRQNQEETGDDLPSSES
jgi:hypothetical protein